MFSIFYNVAFSLFMITKLIFNLKKYIPYLKERVSFRKSIETDKKVIWIHAVSVGEVKATSLLIERLRGEGDFFIVVSTITKTGQEEAKRAVDADLFIYLPLDISFLMRRSVKKIRPDLLIVIETDFWYHLLKYTKEIGCKNILVSGKLSEKSFERFKIFSFFTKRIFSKFDTICVQNREYKDRFKELGFSSIVCGNLKFSNIKKPLAKESVEELRRKFLLKDDDFVITVASTHPGEEKMLLDNIKIPSKIFVAPRHPERFLKVENMLRENNISFCLLSNISNLKGNERVILIDRMGYLDNCYQLSNLTIMGGSFIKGIGGHNILEPIFFGVPSFFGKHMFSQKDLREKVLEFGCGKEILVENLEDEIEGYIKEEKVMRENCKRLKEELVNEAEKTFLEVKKLF